MKVLFLVGPHACGKTHDAKKYVENNLSTIMIDTGPIIRKLYKKSSLNISFEKWINKLEKVYGNNATTYLIYKEIEKIISKGNYENVILVGFRTLKGINYIINKLELNNYNILYYDAESNLLYNNYIHREKNNMSKIDFNNYLNNELNSGLNELKTLALKSNSHVDYFYKNSNDQNLLDKLDEYFKQKQFILERKNYND